MKNKKVFAKLMEFWIIYRSSIIAFIVVVLYFVIDEKTPFKIDGLFSTSITCLSILFGFNMVVVTHYYTNSDFNKFLKTINSFNSFRRRYKHIIKYLIISLIGIYVLSLFDNLEYCFFDVVSFDKISNSVVIYLSLFNLVKAYDCVIEFFNVYGTTYSNTLQNMNNNETK